MVSVQHTAFYLCIVALLGIIVGYLVAPTVTKETVVMVPVCDQGIPSGTAMPGYWPGAR